MSKCKYCHVDFRDRPIAKEKHICKTEIVHLKIRIKELEGALSDAKELENQLAQKDQEIQALQAKLFEKRDMRRP